MFAHQTKLHLLETIVCWLTKLARLDQGDEKNTVSDFENSLWNDWKSTFRPFDQGNERNTVSDLSFCTFINTSTLNNMANNSSSNEFYKSEKCPFLEEGGLARRSWVPADRRHLQPSGWAITINSILVLPTVLLNDLVIFAVVTRGQLRDKSTILLACLTAAGVPRKNEKSQSNPQRTLFLVLNSRVNVYLNIPK